MTHSKDDLPPNSKKIPLEKPAIQPVFGYGKISLWNCFDYAPKRAVFQSRIKKTPSKLKLEKPELESCFQH